MATNSMANASKSGPNKKTKKNKKKANGNPTSGDAVRDANTIKIEGGETDDGEDDGREEDMAESTPSSAESGQIHHTSQLHTEKPSLPSDQRKDKSLHSNGIPLHSDLTDSSEPHTTPSANTMDSSDPTDRLQALQHERDNLRDEVSKLRQSLETLQTKHNDDLSGVKEELEQSQQEKEHAETQYRNLLGKVNTIRSQLGERLKADAAELEQARSRITQLEVEQSSSEEENHRLKDSVSRLEEKLKEQESENDGLRSRTMLSTTNWVKERDELVAREAFIKEEYEVARQAMQDWEILATEERSRREGLEERAADLEEQLIAVRDAHERVKGEVETQSATVDGLQRALREMQEERKRELREIVDRSEAQLEELRKQAKSAEESSDSLQSQLAISQTDLARALPFEKEVKEKNLLIGKLRHEAVILNDHLTKALRFLKRGKPEDNVDRQLVTNHFLHFFALDRSDPKKFQVLQLIAALLGWDEQQKEQAGLVRQGAAAGTLRLPMSPFRRTPSTPSLTSDFLPQSPGGVGKESLAELWSDFLEREAETGSSRGSPLNKRTPSIISDQQGITSPISPLAQPRPYSPEAKRGNS